MFEDFEKENNIRKEIKDLEILIIKSMCGGDLVEGRLNDALDLVKRLEKQLVGNCVVIPVDRLKFDYKIIKDETKLTDMPLDKIRCTVTGPTTAMIMDPSYEHLADKDAVVNEAKEMMKQQIIHEWGI